MNMMELVYIPCLREKRGKYSYPCINSLCPYNRFPAECQVYMNGEERELFEELITLRSLQTRT